MLYFAIGRNFGPSSVTVQASTQGSTLNLYVDESHSVTITTEDYSALTLKVVFESKFGVDVATIADGDLTKSSSSVAFSIPADVTSKVQDLFWSIRDTSADKVLVNGLCLVDYSPI